MLFNGKGQVHKLLLLFYMTNSQNLWYTWVHGEWYKIPHFTYIFSLAKTMASIHASSQYGYRDQELLYCFPNLCHFLHFVKYSRFDQFCQIDRFNNPFQTRKKSPYLKNKGELRNGSIKNGRYSRSCTYCLLELMVGSWISSTRR